MAELTFIPGSEEHYRYLLAKGEPPATAREIVDEEAALWGRDRIGLPLPPGMTEEDVEEAQRREAELKPAA